MKLTLLVVFGVISLAMFALGAYEFFMQQRLLTNAQPVQATITDSGCQMSRDPTADAAAGPDTFSYVPRVTFTYELGGTTYESTLLRPEPIARTYTTEASAAAELEGFAKGASVQAFVNPRYPDQAYLKREASNGHMIYMLIGIGIPMFIFAVIKIAKL